MATLPVAFVGVLAAITRDDLFSYATFAALAVLTSGYLIGSWRRGKAEASKEATDLALQEIELLKSARDRAEAARTAIEREMRATADNCKENIARLEGAVDQLRNENSELRGLVMLEKVPAPLESALQSIVTEVMNSVKDMHVQSNQLLIDHFDRQIEQNREYWTNAVGERLHPIEQGVARLLTTGDRLRPATPEGGDT